MEIKTTIKQGNNVFTIEIFYSKFNNCLDIVAYN